MNGRAFIFAIVMCCCGAAAAAEQIFGDITDIDAAKKTIIVSSECECGSGKIIESNFSVGDDAKISLNKKDCKFADLKLGDQVEVDFESEQHVTKIISARSHD